MGTAGVVGSTAACALSAITGGISYDYALAGFNTAITGNSTMTRGEYLIQETLGISPEQAEMTSVTNRLKTLKAR